MLGKKSIQRPLNNSCYTEHEQAGAGFSRSLPQKNASKMPFRLVGLVGGHFEDDSECYARNTTSSTVSQGEMGTATRPAALRRAGG